MRPSRGLGLRTGVLISAFAALVMGACGGLVEYPGPGDASSAAITTDAASTVAAIGTVSAPDCPACAFPASTAPACASAPSIKVVYPPDTALLPPNLGTISVQWVPYGAGFTRFEVDFAQSEQAPFTDWRIVTACGTQTTDQQEAGSGGCEISVDPASWARLAAANRGGGPIAVTVRGTTDGACASASEDTIHISIAQDDILGTYFYWKSETGALGQTGQVWAQTFGDITIPEQNVTSPAFGQPLCSGCHSLARDGSRMLVYPVDDTDPDYGGLEGSFIDLTSWPNGASVGLARDQPPGLTAIASGGSSYVTSNGLPCEAASAGTCPQSESASYPAPVSANGFSLWDGEGKFVASVPLGAPGTRPTMPDWSVDGSSIVYVQPTQVGSWDSAQRRDDDHIFGGSLYRVLYAGSGVFGAPAVLLASRGENNYYPSYSPDAPASYVLFDRAPLDSTVGALTGCVGVAPRTICPNDSYANPAARLLLLSNAPGAAPIDLESANGSSATVKDALSNSFPRFAPFVQKYQGKRIFWITFSSTRDYGLRVLNHKDGMYPCYPADSYEWPGSVHTNIVDPLCQHPQLWMAPILENAPQAGDPSRVAFWIPYQDPRTDNHMAIWTSKARTGDGGIAGLPCSGAGGSCGPASGGSDCCPGSSLVCAGDGRCILPTR